MNQPSSISSIKNQVHPCPSMSIHVFPQCLLVKPRLNMFFMSWFYPHWLTHSTLGPRSLSSFHATGIPRCCWSSRTQGMLPRSWSDCHFFCTVVHGKSQIIIHIYIYGWWLTYPSEKYAKVSWDDEIPNIWKTIIKKMFQTTNQYIYSHIYGQYHRSCSWQISDILPPFKEKHESSAGYV